MSRKGKVEELEKEKCREDRKSKPLEVEKTINKISAIKTFLLLCITQETYFFGLLEKQCHFWMVMMFYLSQPGMYYNPIFGEMP